VMSNHLLLLGAGFSRNWNGYLAAEITEDLIGRLSDCIHLNELLRKSKNFEDALSYVQAQHLRQPSNTSKKQLDKFQEAILAIFGDMNRAFAKRSSIEFSNQMEFSLQKFFSNFDAIFTLNQDLLLELHYNIELHARPRWCGHHFPGMKPPPNWQSESATERLGKVWVPNIEHKVEPNLQPIFKLHGSVNWRDSTGGQLIVMGANKERTISEKEILNWYAGQFRDCLHSPNTRLMVIGYSFLDEHINEIIFSASKRAQLKMFIVNPKGLEVFNKHPNAQIPVRDKMEDIPIIGISSRPLSTTFAGDELEYKKLTTFFQR